MGDPLDRPVVGGATPGRPARREMGGPAADPFRTGSAAHRDGKADTLVKASATGRYLIWLRQKNAVIPDVAGFMSMAREDMIHDKSCAVVRVRKDWRIALQYSVACCVAC